jgi:hypothetical protein
MTIKTQSEFRAWVITQVIPALLELVRRKGDQYTGEEASVFANFEEGAKLAGDTKEHYLLVQATKQWYVLTDWSKRAGLEEAEKREIKERAFDVITYLLLLLYMVEVQ